MEFELKGLSHLYREDYKQHLENIPADVWERWEKNKEAYYEQCRKVIDYAVFYYGSRTPMESSELRARANLIFCIACLRWDPQGDAALPTYVAKAGSDAIRLYDACIEGWYDRKSNTGARRAITPRGLFLARALPWTCKERYASALEAIKAAANAWRTGADFKGYVVLRKAV